MCYQKNNFFFPLKSKAAGVFYTLSRLINLNINSRVIQNENLFFHIVQFRIDFAYSKLKFEPKSSENYLKKIKSFRLKTKVILYIVGIEPYGFSASIFFSFASD